MSFISLVYLRRGAAMRRTPNRGEGIVTYFALVNKSGKSTLISHKVPVDVGGCLNVLTRDKVYGSPDPIAHVLSPSGGSGGMAVNGRACEVSKTLPVF